MIIIMWRTPGVDLSTGIEQHSRANHIDGTTASDLRIDIRWRKPWILNQTGGEEK